MRLRAQLSGRRALVAALLIATLPFVVGIARRAAGDHVAPNGDTALIELRTRDVGGHTPLVGSYQRFSFNHPGPLHFYLLSMPYRGLGSRFAGMEVGVLLLNGASVAAIGVVAHRRGGLRGACFALTLVGIAVLALRVPVLWDPWEPHLVLLPLALLMLLSWSAAAGERWALPAATAVASLLVQAQAGLGVTAVALLVWPLVPLALDAWREHTTGGGEQLGRFLRMLGIAAAVGVVLWLPPIVDELTNEPGNLRRMFDFFTSGDRDTLGIGRAYETVAMQLDLRGLWLRESTPLQPLLTEVDTSTAGPVPFALLALVAGALVAWRRRDREALRLCGTILVALVTAVVALSRLVGPLYLWIPQWTRPLGLGCWLAAGWALARALPVRDRLRSRATAALVAIFVTVSAISTADVILADTPAPQAVRRVTELARAAAPGLRSESTPILVRSAVETEGVFGRESWQPALVLALVRGGVDVVVDEDLSTRYGTHRAHPERAGLEVVLVADDQIAAYSADGYEIVAELESPTPPSERREYERLRAELEAFAAETGLEAWLTQCDVPECLETVERLQEIRLVPALALAARRSRHN